MHCLMLTYEQATFTGVDAPKLTPFVQIAKSDEMTNITWMDEAQPMNLHDFWKQMKDIHGDDIRAASTQQGVRRVVWSYDDDATPTERLDTNGGDDEVS